LHESVPSKKNYRAHSAFLPRLLRAAALGYVGLALAGVIVTVSAGFWLEAILLGTVGITSFWWSRRLRSSEPESLSRRLSYKRKSKP